MEVYVSLPEACSQMKCNFQLQICSKTKTRHISTSDYSRQFFPFSRNDSQSFILNKMELLEVKRFD